MTDKPMTCENCAETLPRDAIAFYKPTPARKMPTALGTVDRPAVPAQASYTCPACGHVRPEAPIPGGQRLPDA